MSFFSSFFVICRYFCLCISFGLISLCMYVLFLYLVIYEVISLSVLYFVIVLFRSFVLYVGAVAEVLFL